MKYSAHSQYAGEIKYIEMSDEKYKRIISSSESVDIPEHMAEAFAVWCDYFGKDYTEYVYAMLFIDQYQGEYDDIDDFCEHAFSYMWEQDQCEYDLPDDGKTAYLADAYNNGYHMLCGHYAFCTL
nr:MAG TPA: hypothetical protein [Caudoviricetes sp.]